MEDTELANTNVALLSSSQPDSEVQQHIKHAKYNHVALTFPKQEIALTMGLHIVRLQDKDYFRAKITECHIAHILP